MPDDANFAKWGQTPSAIIFLIKLYGVPSNPITTVLFYFDVPFLESSSNLHTVGNRLKRRAAFHSVADIVNLRDKGLNGGGKGAVRVMKRGYNEIVKAIQPLIGSLRRLITRWFRPISVTFVFMYNRAPIFFRRSPR